LTLWKKTALAINHIFSKIETNTIHQFKGREADNVIILGITSWYPFIHPDNEFYFILGRTPQMVLDEERRLLYVAVTRAKKNIYFVHEDIKAH
jgi:superfamily I DNA/RNA helicase